MKVYHEQQIGACGILNLYSFHPYYGTSTGLIPQSGCGLYIANFVDQLDSKNTYNELVKKYKLLYQSPVLLNRNSGRRGFFCVFGDRDQV